MTRHDSPKLYPQRRRRAIGALIVAAIFWAMNGCSPGPSEPPDFRIRVAGTVRNASTRAPITGATLTLTQGNTTESATSFAGGLYLFLNTEMRAGDARLEARAPGYSPYTTTIRMVEQSENTVDIDLTPSP